MSPIFQGDRRDTVVSLFCLVKDERKRDTCVFFLLGLGECILSLRGTKGTLLQSSRYLLLRRVPRLYSGRGMPPLVQRDKRDTPPCVPLVCLMSISPVRFSVKDLSVEGKSSAGFHPLHIVAGEISPPWFPEIVLLCRCLSDGNIIRKETHLWCWHYSGRRFVI